MIMEDDHGYREDWDMTTEEGSLCFASCIHARLVGGEQDESDLTWLANYLRVNSSARTALSQPEPEGPTDIELLSMAGTAIGHEIGFGEYEPETECAVEAYGSELIDFARAVLARWGRPAIQSETNGQA